MDELLHLLASFAAVLALMFAAYERGRRVAFERDYAPLLERLMNLLEAKEDPRQ